MWIRSQDDEILINLDRIGALKHHKWLGGPDDHGPTHAIVALSHGSDDDKFDFELGRYHTAKRVMEVLEEIEDEMEKDTNQVYYMPLE